MSMIQEQVPVIAAFLAGCPEKLPEHSRQILSDLVNIFKQTFSVPTTLESDYGELTESPYHYQKYMEMECTRLTGKTRTKTNNVVKSRGDIQHLVPGYLHYIAPMVSVMVSLFLKTTSLRDTRSRY